MESVEWDAAERPESRYGINHEKSLNFAQIVRAVTKALIGGGEGWIFISSRSARRISFEISCHYS